MTSGEKIVYMCLAGFRWDAEVRAVRQNGTVDIASDVGCSQPHELSRIEVTEPGELRPGTCARKA